MVAYEIERDGEKIILTPEDGAIYHNWTNGMKFRNNKDSIEFKHANPKAKYRRFATITLDSIIIPISEDMGSLSDISLQFKTRKGATGVLSFSNLTDFSKRVYEFVNPCYFDMLHDYFRTFINTVLVDIYSNAELLEYIINGITPLDHLYIGEQKVHFKVVDVYHNKVILECYDDEGEPVDTSFWSIDEDGEILLDNEGHTLGVTVEYYPVNTGETYEISNSPVNVREVGVYKFKNNQLILLFQENTLRVEQYKQALIITIAHTGDLAGTGLIKLVRVLWYNLKQVVLSENPGNDWALNIPPVNGVPGGEVELSGEIVDPNGNVHDGSIRFYIL